MTGAPLTTHHGPDELLAHGTGTRKPVVIRRHLHVGGRRDNAQRVVAREVTRFTGPCPTVRALGGSQTGPQEEEEEH